MALVAQISAFPTQTTPGTPVACLCTVRNNGPTAVSVVSLQPTVKRPAGVTQHAAVDTGQVPLGPGYTTTIGPAGERTFGPYGLCVGAPSGGDGGPNVGTIGYELGAVVLSSDGSTAYAQVATVTAVPYDARFRTGNGSYGPGMSQQTFPSIPALPTFPDQYGAAEFNYWNNSALMPVVL